MEIKDFIKGVKPECPKPPNYLHTWLHYWKSKRIKCIWCGIDKKKKSGSIQLRPPRVATLRQGCQMLKN